MNAKTWLVIGASPATAWPPVPAPCPPDPPLQVLLPAAPEVPGGSLLQPSATCARTRPAITRQLDARKVLRWSVGTRPPLSDALGTDATFFAKTAHPKAIGPRKVSGLTTGWVGAGMHRSFRGLTHDCQLTRLFVNKSPNNLILLSIASDANGRDERRANFCKHRAAPGTELLAERFCHTIVRGCRFGRANAGR